MEEKELQIIFKALSLFQNYGIKSVTMDDLSKGISISKKTLYHYFSDKADLVRKVIDYEFDRKLVHFENVFSDNRNAIEQLLALNTFIQEEHKAYKPSMMFDLKKYYPEVFQDLQMAKRQILYNSIYKNLIRGKKEGLYRPNLDEEILAKLYVFRAEYLLASDIFTNEEVVTNKFVGEISNYHLHGIVSDKGLETLKKLSN